ncbi:hypothetical protein BC826DRAFT_989081, partial [Russula brevipes]
MGHNMGSWSLWLHREKNLTSALKPLNQRSVVRPTVIGDQIMIAKLGGFDCLGRDRRL